MRLVAFTAQTLLQCRVFVPPKRTSHLFTFGRNPTADKPIRQKPTTDCFCHRCEYVLLMAYVCNVLFFLLGIFAADFFRNASQFHSFDDGKRSLAQNISNTQYGSMQCF